MRILLLFIFYYGSVAYSALNPIYGLLFFVHILLLRPENLTWGSPMFGRLHLFAAAATCLGYFLQRHEFSQRGSLGKVQRTNIATFGLFLIWLVVTSALAEYSSSVSFEVTFEIGKIFVFCVLFALLFREVPPLMWYIWVVSLSLGVLSLWGSLQGLSGNVRLEDLWTVGSSNTLGSLLVLMAPFILANILDPTLGKRSRFIFFGCAFFVVLCCVYTESRGAFLGLAVGILLLLVQVRRRGAIIGILALVAVLAMPWLPETYVERMATIFASNEERDASASARPLLWKIAFNIWEDHPIAGVGLQNFSPEKEKYAGRAGEMGINEELSAVIFNQYRVPHSLYFCLLAEVGAVGLALYLFLYSRSVLIRDVHMKRKAVVPPLYFQIKGAQAGLVGFGIAALFGDYYYIEPLYLQMFWVGAAHSLSSREGESNMLNRDSETEIKLTKRLPTHLSPANL